jgi:Flp pilus assembly protein TadB
MAALSEDEIRKILGANYQAERAGVGQTSLTNAEQSKRRQIEAADDNRTFSFCVILIGVALIIASLLSVSGLTLLIQVAVGLAISALGALGYMYFKRRVAKLSAQPKPPMSQRAPEATASQRSMPQVARSTT